MTTPEKWTPMNKIERHAYHEGQDLIWDLLAKKLGCHRGMALATVSNLMDQANRPTPAYAALVAWIKAEIRRRWSFDENQQHTHTWHDRADFLKELNEKIAALALAEGEAKGPYRVEYRDGIWYVGAHAFQTKAEADEYCSGMNEAHAAGKAEGLAEAKRRAEITEIRIGEPHPAPGRAEVLEKIRKVTPTSTIKPSADEVREAFNAARDFIRAGGEKKSEIFSVLCQQFEQQQAELARLREENARLHRGIAVVESLPQHQTTEKSPPLAVGHYGAMNDVRRRVREAMDPWRPVTETEPDHDGPVLGKFGVNELMCRRTIGSRQWFASAGQRIGVRLAESPTHFKPIANPGFSRAYRHHRN